MEYPRRVIWITPELLQDMLTIGYRSRFEVIQGLPEDAKFIRGIYDFHRGLAGLIFEHDSWKPVAHDEIPPVQDVVFKELE